MSADDFTMPNPEWCYDKSGRGVRLFAYSCALSGKEGGASASKGGTGITGLMKELEKTKLDV